MKDIYCILYKGGMMMQHTSKSIYVGGLAMLRWPGV